ncbi:hypothetical protein DFA_10412 [Cavenderia fasciculata]|uniref:Uncharacterized protein n=1 Tax=Cavenderia fasciculata TaxID=261658 RepID=F4QA51_CACFS|nr:uncharacterized protein DFA_10412 [Cavenderia fasciculata]EGG15570.1 hypothetical protein DFA_10412 [Cavenderia fasciculata]|eukprot:XP_004354312.1 hypothetical protein DFA_10412 [Cavenderia fasciculata]
MTTTKEFLERVEQIQTEIGTNFIFSNNNNNNNTRLKIQLSQHPKIDILKYVYMVCQLNVNNNNNNNNWIREICLQLINDCLLTRSQDCILDDLTNETKIAIRSMILDTFERNLRLVCLLLVNHYDSGRNDEEIFRIGIIKWFNNRNNNNNNNICQQQSIIESLLFALSKVKQPCHSVLDIIWRLYYKNRSLGEKDILMFFSIFKHYQFNEQQLKQEITNNIYNNLLPKSELWKNKDIKSFFKQTISILFQHAYNDDYFIPQQQQDNYNIDQHYYKSNQKPKPIFQFLKSISLKDHEILYTIIFEYCQIFLNSTSWKEKLIVLGILNLLELKEYTFTNKLLPKQFILDSIIYPLIDDQNLLVQYELIIFLVKMANSKGIRDIGNQSFYQDVIDRAFEKSFKSNHPHLIKQVESFFFSSISSYKHPRGSKIDSIVTTKLDPFIISLIFKSEKENIFKVINFFDGIVMINNNRRKYLNIIINRILFTSMCGDKQMVDRFIFSYLLDWIFDGYIGKDVIIYLPFIMKRIIAQRSRDASIENTILRLCKQFPDKLYSYMNRLIPLSIELHQNNISEYIFNGQPSKGEHRYDGHLLFCLFTICSSKKYQKKSSSIHLQILLDYILKGTSDDNIQNALVIRFISQMNGLGVLFLDNQIIQMIGWIKNGIVNTHQQILNLKDSTTPAADTPIFNLDQLVQGHYYLIDQIIIATTNTYNYLNYIEIITTIYVEMMLDAIILNSKTSTQMLVAQLTDFFRILYPLFDKKELSIDVFTKKIKSNIINHNTLELLLLDK